MELLTYLMDTANC